ncbi:Gx transporter family protein [Proteocatella sphenisci]|uniref:Gx transporter family protein n=1 Tax=Proteocatella sphenisci TaxID=181070 RepID=UPI00048A88D6|nr:Gx transporter family protein [Proteocatella sphenisci]
MKKTRKITFMALMVAYSLILYFIESMLPGLYFIAPGAKLGLTNIITLSLLYMTNINDAFFILVIRIIMSSIFGGGMSAFMYSISGGILSMMAMFVMKKINFPGVSIVGVSIVGAVFFNIGQLIVSALVIKNISIFVYLPVLMYISLGTGILVGYTSKYIIERLKYKNFS